jgi:hypothetical protein
MSLVNIVRAQSKATSLLTARRLSKLGPLQTQTRHSSHVPLRPQGSTPVRPLIWATTVGLLGGITYALSRSTRRIGNRFEARERGLNRQKWLREGPAVNDAWLR